MSESLALSIFFVIYASGFFAGVLFFIGYDVNNPNLEPVSKNIGSFFITLFWPITVPYFCGKLYYKLTKHY